MLVLLCVPLQNSGVAGIVLGSAVLGQGSIGEDNTPLGIALVLTSAAIYAVYQVWPDHSPTPRV